MGPEFWVPVIDRLPDYPMVCANLGFSSTPFKPVTNFPLVIAHSFGLMWALINLPRPWAGLVSINGFTRFTRINDFPGFDPNRLARMRSRLCVDMSTVMDDFLRLCGAESQKPHQYHKAALSQGLEWLAEWDTRESFSRMDCPVLAIAGTADPIVTESHTRACFSKVPLVMKTGGKHLMPHTHANWIAQCIVAMHQDIFVA
jgi:pimeloyl-[acyl-carrier protein] methyl ester esterase